MSNMPSLRPLSRPSALLGMKWAVPSFILLGAVSFACWRRIALLGDLRTNLPSFYLWYAIAFGGYLTALWLLNRRRQLLARWQSHLMLGIILLAAAAFRLVMLPTTPSLSDDIYRYVWDGRVQQAGIDPYAYPPDAAELSSFRNEDWRRINFPHLRTIYPPLAEKTFLLGAWLGSSVIHQKMVMVGLEFFAIAGILLVLYQRRLSPLWIIAYAWHPLAVLEIAGSGHNDIIGVVWIWLGIALWGNRRLMGSSMAWALAFLSKYATIVLVPWWWMRAVSKRWLILFAFIVAAPLACCPKVVSALWSSLSTMAGRFESNSSFYVLLALILGNPSLARIMVIAAWIASVLWLARREEDPARFLLGSLLAAALLSPVLHPWYVVWLIPFLCLRRSLVVLVLTGVVVLAYTVWPGYLAGGSWHLPLWAHATEYACVFVAAMMSMRSWLSRLSFLPATKLKRLAAS